MRHNVGHDGRVTHYDLAVIGTGSGNSIVDRSFIDHRVALLEENVFGGTCLNVGCIPTKMLVHPADLARDAGRAPELGIDTSYDGARWPEIRDRIFGRIDPIGPGEKAKRESRANIDVYSGHATFLDDHTLDTGTGERISATQIVVAAGSRVDVAEIPGLDVVGHHTSDTVMRLAELPRRMVIVGGGYVAAEFAHIFSALGTQVTQVHRGPRLLSQLDEELSATFTELASRQWEVRLDTLVAKASRRGDVKVLTLEDGSEVETDVVLIATGRVANVDRLGLENTGITVADGLIKVDEFQRTTAEGVWALGDVSSHHQLKHVANLEAQVVRHNLLHPQDLRSSSNRVVPAAVFTSPQIACVGLTSQDARRQDIAHRAATYDYADVAYGWALESTPGEHYVKLLSDPEGQQLLGAHIIGPEASLLLQPLVQAMSLGTPVEQMAKAQYWIHPSLAEVVENALLKLVTI